MFARITMVKATPEQSAEGTRIVRDEFLPWVRESTGFRGLIALEDRERELNVVITLWADEEARAASAEAAEKLSGLAAAVSGAERGDIHDYDVVLLELARAADTR